MLNRKEWDISYYELI